MRRVGNLWDQLVSFENLYSAYKKAIKGTRSYDSYKFGFSLDKQLWDLQEELISGLYSPLDYTYFTIYEPKERIISVAAFKDRVVHHALVNILDPVFEPRFIFDSYATRKGKGTHKAIGRAQYFLRKNRWFLKMDIHKYFYNIDHEILLNLISRKIKDKKVLDLCRRVISKGGEGVGLPIGNLTSQFFANVYLDKLDHYVKDILGIKYYLRYMDDFVLFGVDRIEIKKIRDNLTEFILKNLNLNIKERATVINSSLHGLPFLGAGQLLCNLLAYASEVAGTIVATTWTFLTVTTTTLTTRTTTSDFVASTYLSVLNYLRMV